MINFCKFKKIIVLILFLSLEFFLVNNSFAATKTWKNPAAGGVWTTGTNWVGDVAPVNNDDIVINPSAAITITAVPSLTIKSLTIEGTGDVTLTGASGAIALQINGPTLTDNFVIHSGATLQLTGTTTSFTINFLTTASQQGQIDGTLKINALGVFNTSSIGTTRVTVGNGGVIINNRPTAGTFVTSVATLKFDAGSVYNHIANVVTFPSATWDPTSACNVTGITNATPLTGISGSTMGNFNWNCPSQTATVTMGIAANTTFAGDFTVQTTNTGILYLANTTSAHTVTVSGNFTVNSGSVYRLYANANSPMNIGGNLNVNGGTFFLQYNGTATTLNVYGDVNITNGTFNLNSYNGGGHSYNFYGNINQTGGTFTQTGTTIATMYFRGVNKAFNRSSGTFTSTYLNFGTASGADFTIDNNIAIAASRTFTVNANTKLTFTSAQTVAGTLNNSGTLYCGANVISGTGTFVQTNSTNVTLGIGHANGIAGNITTSTQTGLTSGTYAVTANYVFNGSVVQVFGNSTSLNACNNLIIENTSPTGVVSLNKSNFTVSNVLYLNQGLLSLEGYSLTLSNSGTNAIQGNPFSATNMIVPGGNGYLIKNYPAGASAAFTFPVGDNTDTPEYSPLSIGMLSNSGTGNIQVRLIDGNHPNFSSPDDYLSRYYIFNTSLAAPYTYTLSFSYPTADIYGDEANLKFSRWNGSVWTSLESNAASNSISVTGALTNTNAPLLPANSYTGMTAASNYIYYRSVASGDWNTLSTWEVDTDPAFGSPSAAIDAPTSANSISINIRSGHTVNASAAVTANDLFVNGTFENLAGGALTSTGNIYFNANSVYNHKRDGGAVPSSVWDATSTCNILGITATNVTGLAGNFGNFNWNPLSAQTATGVINAAMNILGNFQVLVGTFNFNGFVVSVAGNVVNNGLINTATTNSALTINGSTEQIISGTGNWTTVTGILNNSLQILTINNSNNSNISLNSALTIQNGLYLLNGVLTGSGLLTLGNGTPNTLTINIGVSGGTSPGASINDALAVNYNLNNVILNVNYYPLTPAGGYTTGKELPSSGATPPLAGTVTIVNTDVAGITLGKDATVFHFTINLGATLNMNGNTLRLAGNFLNNATAANTGLNAAVAESKLLFIGTVQQNITFNNQTFATVITTPDIEISNNFYNAATSSGATTLTTGSIRNLTINNSSYFQQGNFNLNVTGNIVNNGIIFTSGANTACTITFNGTTVQSVSGSGTWNQVATYPGTSVFTGFIINNTSDENPAVILNQNLALQNTLNLYTGILGGSGTLTLGNATASTLTCNVGNGTTAGGSIASAMDVNYNLTYVSYNLNYNILSPAAGYTTGKELPSFSADPPYGGTVTIVNTHSSGVTLGNSATAFNFTINSGTILNMNGKTVRIAGTFTNSAAAANTGLNASVANSKLHFIGWGQQNINLGNQTFSSVITTPDIEISNNFYNATISCAATTTAIGYVKELKINTGSYLQIGNFNLFVASNLINNGLIFASGANTSAMITMNGTAAQTISGSGSWSQIVTNPGVGVFPGLQIFNTSGANPAVALNQSLALQNNLLLSAGKLGGTGLLTLGNSTANILTVNVGVSAGTSVGGSIDNDMNVDYNLPYHTFNVNYYALTPAGGYTTGKELPSLTANPPSAGTVTIVNTNSAGITLGKDATVFGFTINSTATLIMNGKTLRLAGTFNNASATANTGLNSATAGSKLLFIGKEYQAITLNNQTFSSVITAPDIEVNNNYFTNAVSSGVGFTATGTVKNITINSNSYLHINFNGIINVTGNITNNGLFFAAGASTGAFLNFNGTTGAQTISGTGRWALVGAPAGMDMFIGYQINNPDGVVLNQNVALQNRLDLQTSGGLLSGSGLLTLGNATNNTLTVNRSFGAINMTNPVVYNIMGMTYNLNYTATAASTPITTGVELPPASYYDYKQGTLTINNSTANGGVMLGLSSNISSLNVIAGTTFDLNSKTLAIYGNTITVSGVINASDPNATISFIGIAAQTLGGTMAANYTSGYISNIIVNNLAGVGFTNAVQIGSASQNGSLTVNKGILTLANANPGLTLYGSVSTTPTATITFQANTGLTLAGSVVNMGTIYLTQQAQTLSAFTMNLTGTDAKVNIDGNLTISTSLTLTSGIVNMGPYIVNYNATATTPMLIANQSSSSYFVFNGKNSGLRWVTNSLAAGTYRWPIGFAVGSWRPITMQTLVTAATTSSVQLGYSSAIAGSAYSADDIIASGNIRSNYIAYLAVQGSVGTPNITMEYQDADFNSAPSDPSAVNIWYYNVGGSTSQWTSTTPQTTNSVNGSNTTIVKNGAIALTSSKLISINLAESNNDPGSSLNTWIWTAGSNSTAWNTAGNWSPASVPNSSSANVIIPNHPSYQPSLGSSVAVNNITVCNGASLTVGSYTLTISGSFYNSGTLAATSGTVVYNGSNSPLIARGDYGNLTISGAIDPILSPVGLIAISGTFSPGSAVCTFTNSKIWFNGATGQSVPSFQYFNDVYFTPVTATSTISIAGPITVYGNMSIGRNGTTTTFSDNGNQITGPGVSSGKTLTLLNTSTAAGTIYTTTYTGAKALPDFQYYDFSTTPGSMSTVNFNGAITATQTIPAATYGNLYISAGGNNQKIAAGDITVKGNFTIASGTFNDGGNIITLNGNLTNSSSTSSNGGIKSTDNGKILFTGGTAAHVITGAGPNAFGNLEINDGFGATFANTASTTTVNGTLTVTAGILSVNAFTTSLTVTGLTTITTTGTINFTTGTNDRIFNSDVINNGLWTEATAVVVTYNGNLENNGLFTPSTGYHRLYGTGKELRGTSYISIPNVTMNGTYTNNISGSYVNSGVNDVFIATGGFRVTAALAGTGTLTQGNNSMFIAPAAVTPSLVASAIGNTVVYNSSSATSIKTPTGGNYYNLIINPLANVTYSLTGATNIDNNLTFYSGISAGSTFTDANAAYLLSGPGVSAGTLDMNGIFPTTLTLVNNSTNPFPTFKNYYISSTNTINYNAAVAQDLFHSDVASISVGNLAIGAAGVKTARQNITVKGNLAIGGGGLADNENTITVYGNISGAAAHISTGTGGIILTNGTQVHTLSNTGNLGNLTLNDNLGAVTSAAFNITGTLKLQQGIYQIGAVTQTLSGNIQYPAPGGFLAGNLPLNSTSAITIAGTTGGDYGTLKFTPGFQNINTFTMNRTGGTYPDNGSVHLGSNLTLNYAGAALVLSANGGFIYFDNND
ncbi:MAG: hypothetical protein KA792_01935, partial [Bacteroidales bacterium]|nr:hypothetical protein [Bacteroidales bacterium]